MSISVLLLMFSSLSLIVFSVSLVFLVDKIPRIVLMLVSYICGFLSGFILVSVISEFGFLSAV